jgi:hypothetical protein
MGFSYFTFQYLQQNLSPLVSPFIDTTKLPYHLWILYLVQMAVNFFSFVKVPPSCVFIPDLLVSPSQE